MTITIENNRHTRKQGSQVRYIKVDSEKELKAVCSSNVTTEAIDGNVACVRAWGDWQKFKKEMISRGYEVTGE